MKNETDITIAIKATFPKWYTDLHSRTSFLAETYVYDERRKLVNALHPR